MKTATRAAAIAGIALLSAACGQSARTAQTVPSATATMTPTSSTRPAAGCAAPSGSGRRRTRLLLAVARGEEHEEFTISPDGSDRRPLEIGGDRQYAEGGNGTISARTVTSTNGSALEVASATDPASAKTIEQRGAKEQVGRPVLSADSSTVAYPVFQMGSDPNVVTSTRMMISCTDGTGRREVAWFQDSVTPIGIDSEVGTLVWIKGSEHPESVGTTNLQTAQTLREVKIGIRTGGQTVSADHKKVVYTNRTQVIEVSMDTGSTRVVYEMKNAPESSDDQLLGPVRSPDGSTVLVTEWRKSGDQTKTLAIPVDGQPTTFLDRKGSANLTPVSYSPNGRFLYLAPIVLHERASYVTMDVRTMALTTVHRSPAGGTDSVSFGGWLVS